MYKNKPDTNIIRLVINYKQTYKNMFYNIENNIKKVAILLCITNIIAIFVIQERTIILTIKITIMKEVTFKKEFIFKVSEIRFKEGVVCCFIYKEDLNFESYNDLMEGFINNQISFEQNDDCIFLQLIPCQVSQIKF
ncbi:MAG: hypothetical protein IJ736_01015 [Firmicutes bacterium]|nr:hypothetical protein [Bacillota bacterium]